MTSSSSAPGIAYLDGPRLRRSLLAASTHAQEARAELNRLNVFPVPDGDTGTNLALTLRAVTDHLRVNDDRAVGAVAREAAQAAVLGARGNCGMMLSHFLLGFADGLPPDERVEAPGFARALRTGVDRLQGSLERPVEGTILTVMRETAEAALGAPHHDFVLLLRHLVERAREALARTPELLPVLRKAGVVDAGAKGFVTLLEGALLFVHGDPLVGADPRPAAEAVVVPGMADVEAPEETYRYCTEALVRGEDLPDQARVREALRARGDSLIVIRSGDVLKVHVHTDEPDRVFAYLRTLGRLATHKAEDMRAQHAAVERSEQGHVTLARRPVTVVTDSAADLPEEVVRAHGIRVTPLLLVGGDRVERDGVDVSATEFHRRLEADDGELPTTSQPAPADFLATFRDAAGDGETVVGILLGSALSGTFTSAEAAARSFDEVPVELVDSRAASLLQGLLVLKAAELAELAWDPERIAAEIRRVRARSGILFTVDRFDRLLASGRVSRGRAFLGSVLNVKPLLALDGEGRVEPAGRVLGEKRVLPSMMEALASRIPDPVDSVRFGVVHIGAPEIVQPVSERLRRRWGPDVEILTAPATPVIATHLGTGAWGVAWMVDD